MWPSPKRLLMLQPPLLLLLLLVSIMKYGISRQWPHGT